MKKARNLPSPILRDVDRRVRQAIDEGEMGGAVVVLANKQQILFADAYGNRQLLPKPIPMTLDTLFDLASLTKPIATASSVMKLVAQGRVDLGRPVAEYLPEFAGNGKQQVTVRDLLLHQGGLTPDNPLADYQQGPSASWQRICELPLRQPPGTRFMYSDVGFIVLGKLVERVSGSPIDKFAADHFFRPLGMSVTGFNPSPALASTAAATEKRAGAWMVGEVHDPRAHLLGGVAGHAGLFSNAADLVAFGRMLIGGGQYRGVRVLDAEVIRQMGTGYRVSSGLRGLGWDSQSPYSSNRGTGFSERAFGHGGFTGTVFWVDPENELIFVFLSNRLHPDGQGSVNRLAGQLATIFARGVAASP